MPGRSLLRRMAVVLVLCTAAFGQNLLTNGSFETGDFSGWDTGGNFEFTQVVSGPFSVYPGAQQGNFYAVLGPVGSDGTLSQSFADVAGAFYTLSFWLNAVGDDPSDFSVYVDGTQLYAANDPNTGGNWTQFALSFTGTGHDTVSFAFRDDPGYIALDNVSVATYLSTPEPSILLLMCSGFVGFAGTKFALRTRSQSRS